MTTYAELNAQLQQHFANGEYNQALELATRASPQFPDKRLSLDYWRLCAAARLGNLPLVYHLLEDDLTAGLWYGETVLRQSPSFKPLQGLPEFERLVEASRRWQDNASAAQSPLLVHKPAGDPPWPLLFALHGNTSTAPATLPFWQAAVSLGWLLAAPQSSQAMWTGAYLWPDHETAWADVKTHWATLQQDAEFDPKRVAVAGHSMGGEVAIWLALSGALPVRGFVTIGPAVPFLDEPEQLPPLLEAARARGVRGYFIVGEHDHDINHIEIQRLAEKLQAAGIPTEVETIPDATHDFSPAYEPALRRGLTWIEQA